MNSHDYNSIKITLQAPQPEESGDDQTLIVHLTPKMSWLGTVFVFIFYCTVGCPPKYFVGILGPAHLCLICLIFSV